MLSDSGRIETSPGKPRCHRSAAQSGFDQITSPLTTIRQLSPVCKNLDPELSYSARGRLILVCSIRTDTGECWRDRGCGCNFRMTTLLRSLLFKVRPLDRSILFESSGCAA